MTTSTKKELETALKNLLDKLSEIESNEEYKGVWTLAYVHGFEYHGPNYSEEAKEAWRVLGLSNPNIK